MPCSSRFWTGVTRHLECQLKILRQESNAREQQTEMNIREALARLVAREDLSGEQMRAVMQQVMTGEATPSQIGGFLVALRMKGETVDEVAAAASVMRSLAASVKVADGAVDVVGTGGDATSTFNISTCSALVAAAAGVQIAKHGNRSVSSNSGAADFLEAAGVNIDLDPEQVAQCVDMAGIGFMFAPRHHGAMKHAIGPRREMGVRTIFNLLGPLTNPAAVSRQLLGVYDSEWVRPMTDVLKQLGSRHAMVVHGHDGMDEISLSGPTTVAELKDGTVSERVIEPADFGIDPAPLESIVVDGAEASRRLVDGVLNDEAGAARDIVLLNAGAAIYIGGKAANHADGVMRARAVLASGAAREMLAKLVQVSVSLATGDQA